MTRPTVLPTPEPKLIGTEAVNKAWPNTIDRAYIPLDRQAWVVIRIITRNQGAKWFPTISPPIV